jgi:putative Mg2+ transporter-C (MgtC) family protein
MDIAPVAGSGALLYCKHCGNQNRLWVQEGFGVQSRSERIQTATQAEGGYVPTTLTWQDVALRLLLAFLAGAIIGFDRGEHGRPAGLRTTILLALAACVSMLQANLLMNSVGKSSDSFVVLDLMRLPLGILSGVGFIGGGAILRRDNMVRGVTTAATMWFVTVMGLCFGGGQLGLGVAAFALAMLVLWAVKLLEQRLPRDQRATLGLTVTTEGFNEAELRAALRQHGLRPSSWAVTYNTPAGSYKVDCNLYWEAKKIEKATPAFIEQLARRPGVAELCWKVAG